VGNGPVICLWRIAGLFGWAKGCSESPFGVPARWEKVEIGAENAEIGAENAEI
jgi:hypothetical protein